MTSWIVERMEFSGEFERSVGHTDYEEFKKIYGTWYQLAGLRFGQAFCQHFEITDGLLEVITKQDFADVRIRQCWLKT